MKEKDKLTDEPCAGESLCATHGQPLIECANQRLKQVKAAREMDARSMASARAWQKLANERSAERDALKASSDKRDLDLMHAANLAVELERLKFRQIVADTGSAAARLDEGPFRHGMASAAAAISRRIDEEWGPELEGPEPRN